MKQSTKAALALMAAILVAPAARADSTHGFYVDGGVGGVFTPDSAVRYPAGNQTAQFDDNVGFEGGVGYALPNGLRFEGEYYRSQANVSKFKNIAGGSGDIINNDLFVNALYDFNMGWEFNPYVGIGIGPGFVDGNDLRAAGTGIASGGPIEVAYQGIGGIAWQIDHNWALTADYRYVATSDAGFKVSTGGHAATDNQSHNVFIGVRYSFAQPEALPPLHHAAAPMPRAPMAPQAAVAPVPQSYMVFFDFDKSTLTEEAKRILASAAQDYRKGGFVRIVVTGHTDTMGKNAYNQRLSVRRADAVRAELERLGVPAGVVDAEGVGKHGLLVPTSDQVREAQNRRAEIVFEKQ